MNQAQSLKPEFLMLYEIGDRVKVSKKNSLFINVSNLEAIVTGVNRDIYGDLIGYDIYFMSLHRTLSVFEHELIPLEEKVAI